MRSIHRQNAFARKIGLKLLTGVVTFFMVTIGLTWTYQAALLFVESGLVRPPAKMASMFVDHGE